VTLLFTDIEGSTGLLHRLGTERYSQTLERHRQILREEFERRGGYEVDCEGDSFFVAFASAPAAVEAARDAQRRLAEAEWPEGEPVRVRMGLHTGKPLVVSPRYVGADVHMAARAMAAAHGGQILLTQFTADGAEEVYPLRDLGVYRLRGFDAPTRLFQLELEGLQSAFPPPRTLRHGVSHLPRRLDEFVGRVEERQELARLILDATTPLLTLTGPGGVGKTRLAVQLSHDVAHAFEDGAHFASLAPLTLASQVPAAVMSALGLATEGIEDVEEALIAYLREKESLLVLDNLEHLLEAAPLVARILAEAERVQVIATTRERLRVQGERVFAIDPLSISRPGEEGGNDAVELFELRAQQASRSFIATPEAEAIVADICRRVDGLPLAIELAAAQLGSSTLSGLRERLEARLPTLVGGPRDSSERQQTVRATVAWSFDQLDEDQRLMLTRLSVFSGGCRKDAVAAVCMRPGDNFGPFEGIQALIEKSLVQSGEDFDGAQRFWMLETIREFAQERLSERIEIKDAHARYYAGFAKHYVPLWEGEELRNLAQLVDLELPNIREAITTFQSRGLTREAVKLVLDLQTYWSTSAVQEGLTVATRLSSAVDALGEPWLSGEIRLLIGNLYQATADYPAAEEQFREALLRLREHPSSDLYTRALAQLASALGWQDKIKEASQLLKQAEAAVDKSQDLALIGEVWNVKGIIAARTGDPSAEEIVRRCVEIAREAKLGTGLTMALNNLGDLVMRRDPIPAIPILEEALATCSALQYSVGIRRVSTTLGEALLLAGDPREATPHLQLAYQQSRELGDDYIAAEAALSLAAAYALLGDAPLAVATWSHAESTKPAAVPFDPGTLLLVDQHLEPLRQRDEFDFEHHWQRGTDPRFSVSESTLPAP
jgi:predicted ATPase/class 3 adenylate cyclase